MAGNMMESFERPMLSQREGVIEKIFTKVDTKNHTEQILENDNKPRSVCPLGILINIKKNSMAKEEDNSKEKMKALQLHLTNWRKHMARERS